MDCPIPSLAWQLPMPIRECEGDWGYVCAATPFIPAPVTVQISSTQAPTTTKAPQVRIFQATQLVL